MDETFETSTTSNERRNSSWGAVLNQMHGEALDCFQSTLASFADKTHGLGTHLRLGSHLRFPSSIQHEIPTVQPDVPERLDQAERLLGIAAVNLSEGISLEDLFQRAQETPLYAVAEAYDLRWLPYARADIRHREMPHSFLVEPLTHTHEVRIVEAYFADTQWGRSRPRSWTVTLDELQKLVSGPVATWELQPGELPREPTLPMVLTDTRAAATTTSDDIGRYIADRRAAVGQTVGMERLVLDIWHLTRERLLFSLWLEKHGHAHLLGDLVTGWQQLATQSYVAGRRALRGAEAPVSLFEGLEDRLRGDLALLVKLSETLCGKGEYDGKDAISGAMREILAEIVGSGANGLLGSQSLTSLDYFDSFALVELIERTEALTGRRLPEAYDAASLRSLDGLASLFLADQR